MPIAATHASYRCSMMHHHMLATHIRRPAARRVLLSPLCPSAVIQHQQLQRQRLVYPPQQQQQSRNFSSTRSCPKPGLIMTTQRRYVKRNIVVTADGGPPDAVAAAVATGQDPPVADAVSAADVDAKAEVAVFPDGDANIASTATMEDAILEAIENDPFYTPKVNPPQTDLDYNISEPLFRAARDAPPGSSASFWTHKLYRSKDDKHVVVHYCRSRRSMDRVVRQYFANEPVLGFDLEWVVQSTRGGGPRPNVSLMQIASPSHIALFHIAMFPTADDNVCIADSDVKVPGYGDVNIVTPSLKKILEDDRVIKAGVAIKADFSRCKKYLDVDARGILELSNLYRLVRYGSTGQLDQITKRLVPLKTIVQDYLHLPLFKGEDIRMGSWDSLLKMEHIVYAAADAYAGLQVYHVLERLRKAMNPCPFPPPFIELNLPLVFSTTGELPIAKKRGPKIKKKIIEPEEIPEEGEGEDMDLETMKQMS